MTIKESIVIVAIIYFAYLFVKYLQVRSRMPSIKLTHLPFLFLKLRKILKFYSKLKICHDQATKHSSNLVLPQMSIAPYASSEAILEGLSKTFNPFEVVKQLKKIGHTFLMPLANGKKKRFLKLIIMAIEQEIPQAKSELIKSYKKTNKWREWNVVVADFFINIQIAVDANPNLGPLFDELWEKCSQLVTGHANGASRVISPEINQIFKNVQIVKGLEFSSKEFHDYRQRLSSFKSGLLGGIYFIKYHEKIASFFKHNVNGKVRTTSDIANHFNHIDIEKVEKIFISKVFFRKTALNGYFGFPIFTASSELYKQYLLHEQGRADIQTSIKYLAITIGLKWVGTLTLSAICTYLGVVSVPIFVPIGVALATSALIDLWKQQDFIKSVNDYNDVVNNREDDLFNASLELVREIDNERNVLQNELNNHPNNGPIVDLDLEILLDCLDEMLDAILSDIDKAKIVLNDLKVAMDKCNATNLKYLLLYFRKLRVINYIATNSIFLERTNALKWQSPEEVANLMVGFLMLPVLKDGQLAQKKLLVKLDHYTKLFMIGLSNRVFNLYGIYQEKFSKLSIVILPAIKKFDRIAASWESKVSSAWKKVIYIGAQVEEDVPDAIGEHRALLIKRNGEWEAHKPSPKQFRK